MQMTITCFVLILSVRLALNFKCNDYNFYKNHLEDFKKECGEKTRVEFKDKSAAIKARDFTEDEFNQFFSKMRRFQACIRVHKVMFKKVTFPAISARADAKCPRSLAAIEITNNPNLEQIVFGNGTVPASYVPTLMVRGNRKLSNETINKLNLIKAGARKSKRNSIQVYGECGVPKPLESLDDLIDCESLHGDIVLKSGTLPPPSKALKPFNHTGCMRIKDTEVENIDFLRYLRLQDLPAWMCNNEILDNSKLCVREDLEKHLRTTLIDLNMTVLEQCEKRLAETEVRFGISVRRSVLRLLRMLQTIFYLAIGASGKCTLFSADDKIIYFIKNSRFDNLEMVCMGGTVTPIYIETTIIDRRCDIIRGDLIIKDWKGDTTSLQQFSTIRKIKGVLHISDNAHLSKVEFFSALEEIDAESEDKQPALMIVNNSALEQVQFVSLVKIKTIAGISTVIKNNPKLVTDKDEWYEVAGGQNRTDIVLADVKEDDSNGFGSPLLYIVVVVLIIGVFGAFALRYVYEGQWEKFSGLNPTPAAVK